jgi:hypothetical protein
LTLIFILIDDESGSTAGLAIIEMQGRTGRDESAEEGGPMAAERMRRMWARFEQLMNEAGGPGAARQQLRLMYASAVLDGIGEQRAASARGTARRSRLALGLAYRKLADRRLRRAGECRQRGDGAKAARWREAARQSLRRAAALLKE